MNIKKTISIILVCIWMSVVFLFSNQQGEGSGNTSRKVAEIVVNIIDVQNKYSDLKKEELVKTIEPFIRKLAHYTIYAIGGIVIINCISQFCAKEKMQIAISTCIGILYAISDEIHQLIVAGRSGNIKDVIIDSLGVLTGIMFFLLVRMICKKTTSKRRMKEGE